MKTGVKFGGITTGNTKRGLGFRLNQESLITVNAGATIQSSSGVDTALYSDETITITGATITGAVTAVGNITINGGTTITGIVKSSGNVTVDTTAGAITINGSIICGGTLTISGSNAITINAITSTLPAALFSSGTIDIQNTATNLTITLGQNQKSALMAYGGGAVRINVYSN